MQDVLFNSPFPTAAPGRAEFYDLSIVHLDIAGRRVSFVREVHGWWHNDTGRPAFDECSTIQTKAFSTYGDALECYRALLLCRVSGGFKHAFFWHPVSGAPSLNRRMDHADEFRSVA